MSVRYKGISFPFRISPTTGGVETAEYTDEGKVDLIRQSIMQIILTRVNERVVEKYFGTDLIDLNFEPNDEITSTLAQQSIIKSLTTFEPRITIKDVSITRDLDAGQSIIGISYVINRTGQEDAFAFTV